MLWRAAYLLGIVALLAVFVPLSSAGAQVNFLNPDKLFEALKRNITIPIPSSTSSVENIEVPSPGQTLEKASPKLREVNRDIQEETGIDFAKFIGWFAKILKVFFLTIVDLLEKVSESLRSKE